MHFYFQLFLWISSNPFFWTAKSFNILAYLTITVSTPHSPNSHFQSQYLCLGSSKLKSNEGIHMFTGQHILCASWLVKPECLLIVQTLTSNISAHQPKNLNLTKGVSCLVEFGKNKQGCAVHTAQCAPSTSSLYIVIIFIYLETDSLPFHYSCCDNPTHLFKPISKRKIWLWA